jgi:hypothetical protein
MKTKKVLKYFEGSKPTVAAVLGISHQAVSKWPEDVPELTAYRLSDITGGRLRAPSFKSKAHYKGLVQ